MNPVDLGRGASFKGLSDYLLHDQKADTSKRVEWAETVNMMEASPDCAWRLMAGTAKNANALKEAAGVRKGGQQNKKPVYHYVITWPQDDKLSPEIQRKAVQGSLAALDMEDRQALVVAHNDGGAPHVHVMVNMVSAENGTSAKLSHTHRKLSSWAKKFEMEHGLKVTEGRQQNEAKRKAGEQVDAKRKPRNVYEREKREGQDRRTAWLRKKEANLAQTLSREGRQMKQRHSAEWEALKESYASRKSSVWAAQDRDVKAAIAEVKGRYKSKWAKEFQSGRKRLDEFDKSEKSSVSKTRNIAYSFWKSLRKGETVSGSFHTAATTANRRKMVETENVERRDALSEQQRTETADQIAQIKKEYGIERDAARVDYLKQVDDLKKKQAEERARQREKWREYNERRAQNHYQATQSTSRTYNASQTQQVVRSQSFTQEPK